MTLYYLTPEAAENYPDNDGDGAINLSKANRERFGGKATIYPKGEVPEGPRKGMIAFSDVGKDEPFPTEDTQAPVIEPQPEPEAPVQKRVRLGCNIGAGGMGKGTTYGTNYVYPTTEELELAKGFGMESVRIPYRFYRIFNPETGVLDPNVPKLIAVLHKARDMGFRVFLSEHGFGTGAFAGTKENGDTYYKVLTVDQVPLHVEAFTRAFGEFIGQDWFVPSFLNEPYWNDDWYNVAKAFVTEMRAAGWTNQLVISLNGWAGLHSASEEDADALLEILNMDPLRNIMFDAHQYVDGDSSGTHPDQVMGTKGSNATLTMDEARSWLRGKLTPEVEMMRERGLEMLLGEFGIPNTAAGAVATEAFMEWLDENSDVITDATWWVLSSWMLYDKSKSFYGLSTISKNAPSPHLKRISAIRKGQ